MKIYKFFLAVVCISSVVSAQNKKFTLPISLDDFISSMVRQEDREDFIKLYKKLNTPQKKKDSKMGEANKNYYKQLGYGSLEILNQPLAQQIRPYVSRTNCLQLKDDSYALVEKFLIRYGIYQELIKIKAQASNRLTRIRCYVDNMGSKITRWVSSFRSKVV